MENFYKRMPKDVEMPAVSDDQQTLHQEERTIADIYKARCRIDGIRFGLAYSGERKIQMQAWER